MGNKKLPIYLILLLAVSCGTDQKSIQTEGEALISPQVGSTFTVSQAFYDATKDDVQHFIEELNQIIRSRNYNAWRATLSDDYFRVISSQANLQEWSNSSIMRQQRVVLRTAEDYFLYVVVPARQNSRVDEIEFISANRVKAFTVSVNRAGEEEWLRLYDLEKTENTWKIIN